MAQRPLGATLVANIAWLRLPQLVGSALSIIGLILAYTRSAQDYFGSRRSTDRATRHPRFT